MIEVRYISKNETSGGGWASGQRRFHSFGEMADWLNMGAGNIMVYSIREI